MKLKSCDLNRVAFKALLVFFYLLLVWIYVLKIRIAPIVLLGIVLLMALVGNRSEIIAIALCSIPLSTSIQYSYVLVICMSVYVFKYFKEIAIGKNISSLGYIGIMFGIEMLHWMQPQYSIIDSIRVFIPIFFLFFVTCIDYLEIEYLFIVRVLAVTTLLICSILLLNLLNTTGFNINAIFQGAYRFGYMYGGTGILDATFNPNSLAIITLLPFVGLLQVLSYEKCAMIDYICALVLLVFGVLTLSRTYILCLGISIVFYLMDGKRVEKKRIKRIFVVVLIMSISFLIMNKYFINIMEMFFNRFSVSDISNGRNELFGKYIALLISDVSIFLVGVGTLSIKNVAKQYGINAVPHNGLQEVSIALGSMGLVAIVGMLGNIFQCGKRRNKNLTLVNMIPFVVVFIKLQFGQFITSGVTFLMFAFAYFSLIQNMKR